MCVCPVLAPHGRPAPPAPAARPSHYQSQPLVYSRRDARAAAHLTITTSPFCALCRPCTLLLASHKRLYPNAPRVRRRFSTTQGTHARPHPRARARALIRSVCRTACQPACTHSTQHHVQHCTQRRSPHPTTTASALHEARAWHAARTHARTRARARALPLSAAQTASLHTQHTAPCARIRLTTQPAPHNNSLPHASPRRPALTPPAARSEKLQRAPLHACSLSAL